MALPGGAVFPNESDYILDGDVSPSEKIAEMRKIALRAACEALGSGENSSPEILPTGETVEIHDARTDFKCQNVILPPRFGIS